MLYMPASTLATPVVYQQAPATPSASAARYYAVQPSTMLSTMPLLNTALAYPNYAFLTAPVEKTATDTSHTHEASKSVQHVVHHYTTPCAVKTCPCYCEICSSQTHHSHARSRSCSSSRSRSRSPPRHKDHHRHSRRDEFDRSEHHKKQETIDEKIERVRRELASSSFSKHHKPTETIDHYHPPRSVSPRTVAPHVHPKRPHSGAIDYYHPPRSISPPIIAPHVPYKHHYDAPKPRLSSCSRSRSRSSSRRRVSSLPREPWRSSNQNDYPWRDSHLPAYREATLSRSQTPVDDTRVWKETAHERSHQNTRSSASYHNRHDYVYRPKSETEARKWYTQSTGQNADHEVYQALHGGTTTYNYTGGPSKSWCDQQVRSVSDHSFYSDVPMVSTKMHRLNKVDATPNHTLYGCNEPCLHIIPKQGGTLDPPYMKILNAPVTYLH